jgi:large subunit ribosomal protein L11
MDFCKSFNAQTQGFEAGTPLPVVISVHADRTFSFIIKTSPVSFFLKKAAGIEKGSKTTGRGAFVGKVTQAQILEIAEKKKQDLNAWDIEAAARMIRGSARSMGLEVVE